MAWAFLYPSQSQGNGLISDLTGTGGSVSSDCRKRGSSFAIRPSLRMKFCESWPGARVALEALRSIAGLLPHGGSKVQTVIGALVGAGDKACELLCPKAEHPKADETRGLK
jgi:hypothetical protein